MKRSRRKTEEILWVFGLHAFMRRLYAATFARQQLKTRRAMCAFYKKLLPADSLIFDIGANVGVFAHVFASLGAKVIAVEPNLDCLRHIELSYAALDIVPVHAAVGPQSGLASLNVSDIHDDNSSLSSEWISRMERSHEGYKGVWNRTIEVPIVTLDSMVEHFGFPYFIKIDVEGYEEQVLNGLTYQPPLLSFEFNRIYFDSTLRCLDNEVFAHDSEFNYAFGDPTSLEREEWISKAELIEQLYRLTGEHVYGDIFVRLPNHSPHSSQVSKRMHVESQ